MVEGGRCDQTGREGGGADSRDEAVEPAVTVCSVSRAQDGRWAHDQPHGDGAVLAPAAGY